MNTLLKCAGALAILGAYVAERADATPVETPIATVATPNLAFSTSALSAGERARLNRDEKQSAARLKIVVRAALQLAKANNDRFALSNRDFASQLRPFLVESSDKAKSGNTLKGNLNGYAFNDNLRHAWTYELQEPQNIVLFYEGSLRKLRFRATGWSVVAFADGSVRSVTRLQAQKLLWWKDRVLDNASSQIDQTTPEKTAQSFVDALNRGRFDLARQCIVGAKPLAKTTPDELEAARFSDQTPAGWDKTRFALEMEKFASQELADGFSLGRYRLKLGRSAFFDGGQSAFVFDKVWRIAPLSGASLPAAPGREYDDIKEIAPNFGVLSMIAATVLDAKSAPAASFQNAALSKLRIESVNNLKQIGLGAMQFVQEYDEVYEFNPGNYKERIMNYIREESVFHSPLSGNPYAMNPALAGRNLASIAEPARTVLFFEGANGALDFAYNGTANVSFADGHVSSVSPERASGLIWNPPVVLNEAVNPPAEANIDEE